MRPVDISGSYSTSPKTTTDSNASKSLFAKVMDIEKSASGAGSPEAARDGGFATPSGNGAPIAGIRSQSETSEKIQTPKDLGKNPGDTGAADGRSTVANCGDPGKLSEATAKLQHVNDDIKANHGQVSDADYAYLKAYYNETAKNSSEIYEAIKGDPSLCAQYADGLLNLSRGCEGRGGSAGLPPNVRDVLNSRIGEEATTPKGLDPTGGPKIKRAVWKDNHWDIKNYDNDTAFADLLSCADKDVQGSTQFYQQLATTAINWKQDIDTIQQNTAAWRKLDDTGLSSNTEPTYTGLPPVDPRHSGLLRLRIDDSGASKLLTTISNDADASAQILLNRDDRLAILGLPWQGQGAADLIESGTAPGSKGNTTHNDAALKVIQDAGSDYENFANIVSTPVKEALTQLAVTHLASFGDPTGQNAISKTGPIPVPNGVPGGNIPGVSLSDADAANYLKLISLSGPKYSGIVHAAAIDLGAKWLQEGKIDNAKLLQEGKKENYGYDSGAYHASMLIGRVSSSEYAAALDKAKAVSDNEQQEYIGQLVEQQRQAQQDALKGNIFDTINSLVDVCTMGEASRFKDTIGNLSTVLNDWRTANDDFNTYNGVGQNTPDQDQILKLGKQVQELQKQPQQAALVRGQVEADLQYAALKAEVDDAKVAGKPVPNIDPSKVYSSDADAGYMQDVVAPAVGTYYGDNGGVTSADTAIDTMIADPGGGNTGLWKDRDVRLSVTCGKGNEIYEAQVLEQHRVPPNGEIYTEYHLVNVTPK